jgi:AcrR family transcriptional regulator
VLTTANRRAAHAPRKDLRTAILDAARALCFAHGAGGISARKIAARVGCSATTIYLYYRNVDDVLHALRMEGHGLLAEAFATVDPRLSALDQVRAMGRAYYRFGLVHHGYFDLMFSFRPTTAARRDVVQREMYTLMLLRDVVTRGMNAGEIRRDLDAMVVTNTLWAEIHGVTVLAVSGMLMETTAGHHEEVLEATLDGAVRWLESALSSGKRHG